MRFQNSFENKREVKLVDNLRRCFFYIVFKIEFIASCNLLNHSVAKVAGNAAFCFDIAKFMLSIVVVLCYLQQTFDSIEERRLL